MKIEVNIEKRYAYGIIGLLILVFGFLVVNAYGTSTPAVFGHSAEEIEEADPTVHESVKDGVDWSELSGIPTDIADGDDVGGEGYCYTHYSTSLSSCTCSAGEINKKNLGLWGWCTDYYYGATIFRPSGSSCVDVDPSKYYYQNTDVGLSCVCCA